MIENAQPEEEIVNLAPSMLLGTYRDETTGIAVWRWMKAGGLIQWFAGGQVNVRVRGGRVVSVNVNALQVVGAGGQAQEGQPPPPLSPSELADVLRLAINQCKEAAVKAVEEAAKPHIALPGPNLGRGRMGR